MARREGKVVIRGKVKPLIQDVWKRPKILQNARGTHWSVRHSEVLKRTQRRRNWETSKSDVRKR